MTSTPLQQNHGKKTAQNPRLSPPTPTYHTAVIEVRAPSAYPPTMQQSLKCEPLSLRLHPPTHHAAVVEVRAPQVVLFAELPPHVGVVARGHAACTRDHSSQELGLTGGSCTAGTAR